MGALDILGQLNISNLLFDKTASDETKDTSRETLQSSFEKMSSSDIGLATSEMIPGNK